VSVGNMYIGDKHLPEAGQPLFLKKSCFLLGAGAVS